MSHALKLVILCSTIAAAPVSAQTSLDDGSADDALSNTTLPTPIGRFAARLAYNSDRGAIAGVLYENFKFAGQEQLLRLSAEVSEEDTRFGLAFQNDNLFGEQPQFGLRLSFAETRSGDVFQFDSQSATIEPRLTWTLSEDTRLTTYVSASSNDIYGLSAGGSAIIAADEGDRNRQAIGAQLSFVANNTRASVTQEFGWTSDNTSYSKSEVRFGANTSVLEGRIALFGSLSAGVLNMTSGASSIGDRYVLGAGSIRGFEYGGYGPNDLDPALTDDTTLGGNKFATARFDMLFPQAFGEDSFIIPGLFVDTGSLWDLDNTNGGVAGTTTADDSLIWRSSAGATLLFNTPYGRIQLVFASPFQKESYDETSTVQLSLNAAF